MHKIPEQFSVEYLFQKVPEMMNGWCWWHSEMELFFCKDAPTFQGTRQKYQQSQFFPQRENRSSFPRELSEMVVVLTELTEKGCLPISFAVASPIFLNVFKEMFFQTKIILIFIQAGYLQAEI